MIWQGGKVIKMSEGTFLRATLKKVAITSNEALVDVFMKYLGCFDNPHVSKVSFLKVGEQFTIYPEHVLGSSAPDSAPVILQVGIVHDFLKKTIADNPDAEFDSISSYGTHLFDGDKYGFAADTIIAQRNALSWQGLSPYHYGIGDTKMYYKMKGVWLRDSSKEGQRHEDWIAVPLPQIQDMLFGTLKRIIEAFDPVLLSFIREYAEDEGLWDSQVLYFRDPYLFCLDLKPDADINDADIVEKLNEIKKVLTLGEFERILKEHADGGNYEVWKSPYRGIGVFNKLVYERFSTRLTIALSVLRGVVRERGVDLPVGRIEEVAKYEAEYIQEKGTGKRGRL